MAMTLKYLYRNINLFLSLRKKKKPFLGARSLSLLRRGNATFFFLFGRASSAIPLEHWNHVCVCTLRMRNLFYLSGCGGISTSRHIVNGVCASRVFKNNMSKCHSFTLFLLHFRLLCVSCVHSFAYKRLSFHTIWNAKIHSPKHIIISHNIHKT